MPFKPGKSGNPSGLKKGTKHKTTIEKEVARELLRDMVKAHLAAMTEAQISNAKGIKYLVAREKKTGKFKKLSEAEAILKMGEDSETEVIEVWEERPNVQAYTDLLNRTLDKPTETVQASVTVTNIDERLRQARIRLGKSS